MLNFVIARFISLMNEALIFSNREKIASVFVENFVLNRSIFDATRLVKLVDWISRVFLIFRDVQRLMSSLNDDDDDELDNLKKNDFVIFQSRRFIKLNKLTIVETSRRIFTLNKSVIELMIYETSRRFIWKCVSVVSAIFHRDVAWVRKNKTSWK